MDTKRVLPSVELTPINAATRCAALRCRNSEIDKWFSSQAIKDHDLGSVRVTCAVEPGKSHPLGFYAVAAVVEEVSKLPGRYHRFGSIEHFSALQLVWLATDWDFQGLGLGRRMVGEVIRLFARVGPLIGLPHLIVHPARQDLQRLTDFYGDLGFKPYADGGGMFLSLQAAEQIVQNAERRARNILAAQSQPPLSNPATGSSSPVDTGR